MKKNGLILFLFVVLFSCSSRFPDYTEKEKGIYQQLILFDEENEAYKENRYTNASIKLFDKETLIYKHYKEDVLRPNKHQFGFLFNYLNEGDSASFMLEKNFLLKQMPILNNVKLTSQFIRAEVKIANYFTDQSRVDDPEMIEQILLKNYLKETEGFLYKKGVYIKRMAKGDGASIRHGDDIRIHYKANFINRLEFDNTYKKMDFRFNYGTPGQVIKGLSIALMGMKTGEKAKIIIPSQLAFGEGGSSTQVVPAFTTVIYELEIVNVN